MKRGKITWLDRGCYPVFVGYCPDRQAWAAEVKKLGHPELEWPGNGGNTTYLDDARQQRCILVTLNPEGYSLAAVAGILAHEATHVWQRICEHIGEDQPGWEISAYQVGHFTEQLLRAWMAQTGRTDR